MEKVLTEPDHTDINDVYEDDGYDYNDPEAIGALSSNVACHRCGGWGHYVRQCTFQTSKGKGKGEKDKGNGYVDHATGNYLANAKGGKNNGVIGWQKGSGKTQGFSGQ